MPLAGGYTAGQTIIHGLIAIAHLDQMQTLVFDTDRSQQGKRTAVAVAVGRFVQRDIVLTLAARAEVHEDFIFNTSRRVGRQPYALIRLIGADRLDQSDGAD